MGGAPVKVGAGKAPWVKVGVKVGGVPVTVGLREVVGVGVGPVAVGVNVPRVWVGVRSVVDMVAVGVASAPPMT